mmetsp:Transcript_41143/g.87088  ORF Transcript_41143/g.87088 Transcript_41143/m.87088 type:complete len:578 (-) Transcript_41143:134-1867(-)
MPGRSVDRVQRLVSHVTAEPVAASEAGAHALATLEEISKGPFKRRVGFGQKPQQTRALKSAPGPGTSLLESLDQMEDQSLSLEYDVAQHLGGPLKTGAKAKFEIVAEYVLANGRGTQHTYWSHVQKHHCGGDPSANFVLPIIMMAPGEAPMITNQVMLAHPEDCERIAREHVKKHPNFSLTLCGQGVIATTDKGHWRQQRDSLISAFHPIASLKTVFATSVAKRAEKCVHKLKGQIEEDRVVDMSDFLLHEALAQLMLGMMGLPEEFMDHTNKRFRQALATAPADDKFVRGLMETLVKLSGDPSYAAPEDVAAGRSLHGPLSRVIHTTTPDEDSLTKLGNAFIFAFAGHDTTGHTMTWLLYELAKNPDVQIRLQQEVDEFFVFLNGRSMEYGDLSRLPFMTRCIMETLRLWPAVANGTFRQLEHDDWVHGLNGEKVRVPEGTYVQVINWLRHRNPKLWGPDAEVFNPDREFTPDEIWEGRGFSARNPSTLRFSPFTFQPRDCMGKNFAQSEMRAILTQLLHHFTFELEDPSREEHQTGVNFGTLGPRDFSRPAPAKPNVWNMERLPVGMRMRVTPRR